MKPTEPSDEEIEAAVLLTAFEAGPLNEEGLAAEVCRKTGASHERVIREIRRAVIEGNLSSEGLS